MELPQPSQERDEIGRTGPLRVMLAVIVFGALLSFVATGVLSARSARHTRATSSASFVHPVPEVSHVRMQLIEQPGAGEVLKARQRAALQHYGWVDRSRGIVRLPIDVAIELEIAGSK